MTRKINPSFMAGYGGPRRQTIEIGHRHFFNNLVSQTPHQKVEPIQLLQARKEHLEKLTVQQKKKLVKLTSFE